MSEINLRFIGIGDDGGKYEFGFRDILEVDSTFGVAIYEGKRVHIDPATIQLADDPRKHPMFTVSCPNCDYEYMDPFEDGSFECPECELYLPPKKDPRKAMLDELRLEINKLREYKSFVRVEGDPVPTLPQIAKWCVIWILDEMEAKL